MLPLPDPDLDLPQDLLDPDLSPDLPTHRLQIAASRRRSSSGLEPLRHPMRPSHVGGRRILLTRADCPGPAGGSRPLQPPLLGDPVQPPAGGMWPVQPPPWRRITGSHGHSRST